MFDSYVTLDGILASHNHSMFRTPLGGNLHAAINTALCDTLDEELYSNLAANLAINADGAINPGILTALFSGIRHV